MAHCRTILKCVSNGAIVLLRKAQLVNSLNLKRKKTDILSQGIGMDFAIIK